MSCDRYTPYKVYLCCPDLQLKCNLVEPAVNISIVRPTLQNVNGGQIIINFNGLTTRFELLEQWTGNRYVVFGQRVLQNLPAGTYTFRLFSLTNPDCVWIYEVIIPPAINFITQLFYQDNLVIVPNLNNQFIQSFITPEFQIRTNSDRILALPDNLNLSFQIISLGQFTAPLFTSFDDFTSYGPVPNFLVAPGLPAQTPVVQANNQRPPLIVDIQNANNVVDDIVVVNLVPNNGNGWIRIRMWDSSLPIPFMNTYWVYLVEAVLP